MVKSDEPKNRWVSYFDLLGFKHLIEEKSWLTVFCCLSKAIEETKKQTGRVRQPLEATWFSDTFILYSDDDSGTAFTDIQSASRWFMYFLITGNIPARGAMSCGELYADKENNVLFGRAFIEAHNYGEYQNWIGFVICPSAKTRMTELGLRLDTLYDYSYWTVPRKSKQPLEDRLLCCLIGEKTGEDRFLKKLKELHSRPDNPDKAKYENAISFIEANQRHTI